MAATATAPVTTAATAGQADAAVNAKKLSKNARKMKKALKNMDLLKVNDIFKVVLKQQQGAMFVVDTPEVWKSRSGNTYVVLGHNRVESMQPAMHEQLARKVGAAASAPAAKAAAPSIKYDASKDSETSEFPESSIESVMSQVAGCTREAAIASLKKCKGDTIDAIVNLN